MNALVQSMLQAKRNMDAARLAEQTASLLNSLDAIVGGKYVKYFATEVRHGGRTVVLTCFRGQVVINIYPYIYRRGWVVTLSVPKAEADLQVVITRDDNGRTYNGGNTAADVFFAAMLRTLRAAARGGVE